MIRILASIIFIAATACADDFVEEFANLDAWESLTFPKIARHSTYAATSIDARTVVEMAADASASGMISKTTFSPAKTPYLTFRWKISRTLPRGDGATKDGDDYPVRIYVAFTYDPKTASFSERLTFAAAKLRLGKYPPHSSLNYVWANRKSKKPIFPNPYTDRARMIPLDAGDDAVGTWRTHTVNILDDYRRAFGKAPPKEARLAVMIDTDNTEDRATSWIDYIHLRAEPPKN